MDKGLREEFAETVSDAIAKRDAEKLRYRKGETDEEIRALSAMAAELKAGIEDMMRETYGRAKIPNPIKDLQIVPYPRAATPQKTVVSFTINERPCRIAAVMDLYNRPVFRGITPDGEEYLHGAKPTGGVNNITKTIFSNLITMLSDPALSGLRVSLFWAPGER